MRLHLLSTLDLLRGGQIAEARDTLHAFRARFPGRDLRVADQSSLVDALSMLLAEEADAADLNLSSALAAEIERIDHWRRQ